jgi:imidazolonepropionase-like amidohydrolase
LTRLAGVLRCAAFSLLVTAAFGDSLVIKNVRVHPVTAPDIENGQILIVDGKIADVGKKVSGRGAKTIDGHGLDLYPGLINAATNIGLEEIGSLRDTVDLNEIGEFNPQLLARMSFNPASAHIDVTRAAGITSVLALPGTGGARPGPNATVFYGQGAVMRLDGWTWDDMTVKAGAVLDMNFPVIGTTPPKPFPEMEKEYRKKLGHVADFFENARRYEKAKAAANSDFKPDPRFEAMIPVLEGKRPVFVRAARERAIKEAVAFADRQKIRIIIAGPEEIGSAGPLLKARQIPVILGNTLELPLHNDSPYDSRYTLPNEFHKAGVKICFGTFDVQFARNVGFQAAAAVAFGLPYDVALKGVTINAAEILGVGSQLGSIDKGKAADLILTDGDPLEAKTNIKMEFINGKQVSLENRQTQLYEKYLNRP